MRARPAQERLAALAALGLVAACAPDGSSEKPGAPGALPRRIVLVTLDTLRYDAFAGGSRGPACMPRLARLAERGLVFERHYAATSTTQPTHATLLTGRHPWEHGVVRNGVVLGEGETTLAQILRAEGYWTAAAVASFPVTARFGFDRGFEVFDEELDHTHSSEWNDLEVGGDGFYRLADRLTGRALDLLDTAPRADQFLWFHYYDPHAPYGDTGDSAPLLLSTMLERFRQKGRGKPLKVDRMWRLYREDVTSLDEHLGRLVEHLIADDRFRTHVIVTADHGESIGEERSIGHGKRLSEPEIRVPLVVLSPDVEPGRRTDPSGSVDVFATLLALAGLDPSGSGGADLLAGPGTLPVLGMRRSFEEPHREWLTDGSLRVVEGHEFYLLDDARTVRGNAQDVRVDGDPLDPEREQGVRELFRTLERAVEGLHSTELDDDETRRALEALGYAR